MTDRFSGKSFSDPQSEEISKTVKARKFSQKPDDKDKKDKTPTNLSELYNKGVSHLQTFNFTIELDEGGDHVKHRILRPAPPQDVRGISYPASFQPLQDISSIEDFQRIERLAVELVHRVELAVRARVHADPLAEVVDPDLCQAVVVDDEDTGHVP